MGKLLTREEWAVQKTPIYWRRPSPKFNWGTLQFDIALKWIDDNSEGWFYFEHPTFIFGSSHDAVMFELWLRQNVLDADQGHI